MLKIEFLATEFINPLIVPSGIIQEIPESLKALTAGAGGVVTKSITAKERRSNPLPRVIRYPQGILNSVGLRNPGIDKGLSILRQILERRKNKVIVSIFSTSVPELKMLVTKVAKLKPKFIELNLSCPNTINELGESLGMGVDSTYQTAATCRQAIPKSIKLIAKLSPNVANIGDIAQAAEKAGADAISAINTVGPGMVIDLKTQKPLLGNKEGGVSGPGIKPIAVRCVYDLYQSVKIPIIGMGGVETAEDVIEMMLAGATLVGVGSAIYRHGFGILHKIILDLENYLQKYKIKSLKSLIGKTH